MTVGEFAKKYGIPYSDVRQASWKTALRADFPRRAYGMNFDELVLKRAVKEFLKERLQYYGERTNKTTELLTLLDGQRTEG